ncbi:MAG: hypothetical protein J0L62_06890 [Bacteroidetes bacterium]|nr:hypothetical protein [Bacteroidota bacterium]
MKVFKSEGYSPKITNDFSYRINQGFEIKYLNPDLLNPGFFFEGMSNLASSGVRDYSLAYRYIFNVRNYYAGLSLSVPVLFSGLAFDYRIGVLLGQADIKEKMTYFYAPNEENKLSPHSSYHNFLLLGIEPGARYEFSPMSGFTGFITASYLITTSSSVDFDFHRLPFKESYSEKVQLNRTGLRLKTGLGLDLTTLFDQIF